MMGKTGILFFILIHFYAYLSAQERLDTLQVSSKEAQRIFLDNNLSIIAERLHIDQADALILQAKAWPNPNLSIDEINFNRNETSEKIPPLIGNFGRNQQFTAQVEQLILTARKRKKNIQLETSNREMAKNTFLDLLQSLKVEFKSALSELVYQQHLKNDLIFQNELVDKLLKAQSSQLKLGSISRADFLRIKALKVTVNADLNNVEAQIQESQSNIKTLMAVPSTTYLLIQENEEDMNIDGLEQLSIQNLLDAAIDHNIQLKIAANSKDLSTNQLAIERAKRVPDITLNLNYDRAGSTMFNFFGAGIAMDIPLFDRNKGNIKYAMYEIQKNDLQLEEKKLQVKNQVVEKFQNMQHTLQLLDQIDKDYINELQQVQTALADHFIKRNLSLLEFLDRFNSFKENKQLYYQTLRDIQIKQYELNYLTGREL